MMDRAYIASLLVTAVLINILYAQIIPPKIEEPLSTKTEYVKEDQTFVLQCTAKGDPAPKYRWLKDGKDAPPPESMNRVTVNKDNGTLTISWMTSNEVGNYQCIADSLVPDGKGGQKMLSALSPFINVQRVYVGSDWPDPERNSFDKTVGEYMGLECLNPPTSVPAAIYLWYTTNNKMERNGVLEDNRIYIDKKGTLHFVYVEKEDQPPTDHMYMCAVFNGPKNIIKLGSPAEVVIQDGTPSPQTPVLKYRTSNEDAVFLMNTDAELECVFSGYDVPEITWLHQQVEIQNSGEKYQLVEGTFNRKLRVLNLKETDEGVVTCKAKNNRGDIKVFIHLDVTSAPIWVQGLSSQTVVEGRDAVFTCDARSAHGETPPNEPVWFMNGKPFQPDNSGKYEFSDRRRKLTVKKVDKLTDVNCFQCNVSNHMGYKFADGCLTIIQGIVVETKPNLKQEITFGQHINLTVVGKTDPSMTLKYKWRFNNVTYKLTPPPFVNYDPVTKAAFINTPGLTDEQYASVAGIYYRELYHDYDRVVVPIEVILTDKTTVLPVTPAGGSLWWLVLIIALIVLIVVIILIVIICNRKMQESTYRGVDVNSGRGLHGNPTEQRHFEEIYEEIVEMDDADDNNDYLAPIPSTPGMASEIYEEIVEMDDADDNNDYLAPIASTPGMASEQYEEIVEMDDANDNNDYLAPIPSTLGMASETHEEIVETDDADDNNDYLAPIPSTPGMTSGSSTSGAGNNRGWVI